MEEEKGQVDKANFLSDPVIHHQMNDAHAEDTCNLAPWR